MVQFSTPVTKTRIKFSLPNYLRVNVRRGLKLRLMIITGGVAHYIEKSRDVYRRYVHSVTMQKSSGRPDAVRMKELSAPRMANFSDSAHLTRARILSDDEVQNANFNTADGYQSATAFLHRFLTEHSSEITTVVNVGCGLDNISEWLSRKHPNVQFISNDVMEDVEDIHSTLLPSYSERSNWHCVSGYQHDLIREGKLEGELFFTKSTAGGLFPRELDSYISLLSETVKYVYFLEAWDQPVNTLNVFKLVRPEDVDPEKPFLSGGGFFYHNFIAMFNRHGFDVLRSELYSGPTYTLHILAKNRKL